MDPFSYPREPPPLGVFMTNVHMPPAEDLKLKTALNPDWLYLPGENSVEEDTKRPDVDFRSVRVLSGYFRSQVGRCATKYLLR